MSDIQGDRPEDQTPAVPTQPAAEAAAQPAAQAPAQPEAPAPAPAAPAAADPAVAAQPAAPVPPAQPAAPPVPPAAQPAAAQPTAAQPAAAQPPLPTQPVPPAGYPTAAHAYARPQGYAGQPAPYPQSYAGQPAPGTPGAAFGVNPADAQPTQPIGGAAPATAAAPKKSSGAGKIVGLIVAAAIVGGAAGLGGAYAGVNWFSPASNSPAAGPTTVTVNDTESVNQTTAIAAKVVPSVVTIEATSSSGAGTGSGVVLTKDGYVVTNTHVVTLDGATGDATIRVTTSDGRVYDAEVVGTDPTYDLAVIKLKDAKDLTPISFADSSKLNVGDTTVAVGAPLGLANSVTEGIVSALNRSISIASSAAPDTGSEDQQQQDQGDGQQSPFRFDFGQGQQQQTPTETISISVIQTDAAINPGNSGGALVDSDGKLIGINVAIATAGGSSSDGSGSIGVGFSIPSDVVKRITGEIIENGAATHGLLGASVKPAASVEGSTITGAYIDKVVDGGAAAAAGLQKGDVVTGFNGVPVTDATDLTAQVRAAAAGSKAEVTFVRDGKTQTVEVTLGTLEQ